MPETASEVGKRLIPHIVDRMAADEPHRVVYRISKSKDISRGFSEVTARNFADSVNKTAWWLQNLNGKSETFETCAWIGPHDIRYYILTVACVKAGYKALFLSTANSKAGAENVMSKTDCKIWIQPVEREYSAILKQILPDRKLKIFNLPTLEELLDTAGTKYYEYNKTYEEAMAEPLCVLHSSGSTGLPKSITITHGLAATMDAIKILPHVEGDHGFEPWAAPLKEDYRVYCPNELVHATATMLGLLSTFFFRTKCIMGPVDVEPDMELFSSLADHANIDIWFVLPKYINELSQTPDALAKVARSKFIYMAGGPVSPASADIVNQSIRFFNFTGTTEGLMSGNLCVDQEDKMYFGFHPYAGFDFREIEPGVYEHWVVRTDRWKLFQGIFHTFPDVDEVNLKDLYTKHPTKPDHWLYKCRNDDVIALSDGIKYSPLEVETTVMGHPDVKGCVVFGHGQKTLGLLVELHKSVPSDPRELRDIHSKMKKQIRLADQATLYRGYLEEDRVLFADKKRPFKRTDKLTIKRQPTLDLYAKDIKQFYYSLGDEVGWTTRTI